MHNYDCIFFAEDINTARFFATEKLADATAFAVNARNLETPPKNMSVIEFKIPLQVAINLEISDGHRRLLGEYTGMVFPDIAYGTGFERILIGSERIIAFNGLLASKEISQRRLRFDR